MFDHGPRPGLVGLVAVLCVGALCVPCHAGWWDAAGGAREATLADLTREPERWRDVPVLLDVRVGAVGAVEATEDGREWHRVTIRSDARERSAAPDLPLRVEVRAKSLAALRLRRLASGSRVLLRAVLRDDLRVQLLAATVSGDPLTPEELGRVRVADRFAAGDNARAAERLYRRVLTDRRLAPTDAAAMHRKLAAAVRAQGRPADALLQYRAALRLEPDDRPTRESVRELEAHLDRERYAPPAGRAARPLPEKPPSTLDIPVLLPGSTTRLAPPAGLRREKQDGTTKNPADERQIAVPPPRLKPLPAPPRRKATDEGDLPPVPQRPQLSDPQ